MAQLFLKDRALHGVPGPDLAGLVAKRESARPTSKSKPTSKNARKKIAEMLQVSKIKNLSSRKFPFFLNFSVKLVRNKKHFSKLSRFVVELIYISLNCVVVAFVKK